MEISDMSGRERRRYSRFPVDAPHEAGLQFGDARAAAALESIGIGGAGFQVDGPPAEIGTSVTAHLDGTQACGTVAWCANNRVGVSFDSLVDGGEVFLAVMRRELAASERACSVLI